jgi:O-antigen ligase
MTQHEAISGKARNTLATIFVALSVLDAALVPISRDWYSIGRILLTIVVMYFVWQGKKWAKWLLIGICSLVAILLTAMVAKLSAKLSTLLIVGSLLLIVGNAVVVAYLSTSKDLSLYFSKEKM